MQVETVHAGEQKADPVPHGTDTLWQRLFRGAQRVWERSDWVKFVGLDWTDRIMGAAVTDDFHAKQGRSTGRWVLQTNGRRLTVYLKRHYRLPWWRGLLAALWPRGGWSPGLQEWRHLQWARAEGLPVPAAVAAGEYIGPWGRLQSFLAVEELTGMLPLQQAIPLAAEQLEASAFRVWKRGLIAEMVRITRALHDRRSFHKDLYLCHFYIPREDTVPVRSRQSAVGSEQRTACCQLHTAYWRGRVHLIDLHRLGHHPWTWRFWQAKDLAELLYSSEVAGVVARDRLYFWRLYLGAEQRSFAGCWLSRYVLFKWRRYRQHNARRKLTAGSPGLRPVPRA